MTVTYKPIDDTIEYNISPLVDSPGEVLSIDRSRKRESSRSGLLVTSDTPYPLGTPVQVDIKFTEQEFTFRARGIVSWNDPAHRSPALSRHRIGITITQMDKLDRWGISVSLTGSGSFDVQPPPPDVSTDTTAPISTIPDDGTTDLDDEFGLRGSFIAAIDDIEDDIVTPEDDARLSRPPAPTQANTTSSPPSAPSPPPHAHPHGHQDPGGVHPPAKIEDQSISISRQTADRLLTQIWQAIPPEMFDEPVYVDEFFILPTDRLPQRIADLIQHPPRQTQAQSIITGDGAGRIAFISPQAHEPPPHIQHVEQLLKTLTGQELRLLPTDRAEDVSGLNLAVRIASTTTSIKSVLTMNHLLADSLSKLLPPKRPTDSANTPPAPGPHSRISQLPLPPRRHFFDGPYANHDTNTSMEIDVLMVDAFEKMQALYHKDTRDDAAAFTLELAMELIPSAGGIATLVAADTFLLQIVAATGAMTPALEHRVSATEGISGYCMRHSNVLRTDSTDTDFSIDVPRVTIPLDNTMCAPIMSDHGPLGTVQLFNSESTRGYTRQKADLLAYICQGLGEYITQWLLDTNTDKTDI